MDIELLAAITSAIIYWRTTLGFILFACFAVLFSQGLHWFTVVQGVVFSFLGAAIGGMLDAVAESKVSMPSPNRTTSTVANMAAALSGFVWGVGSSNTWESIAFGLPFLLIALALWRRTAIARHWLDKAQITCCIGVTSITYMLSAILANAGGVI
jgi:hypothetical protein